MSDLVSIIPAGLTPTLTLATLDRHLGWALTLTAVTVFVLQRAPGVVRCALGAIAFMIALVPTTWGLSYWLGLAYQTPSLMAQGLALIYLLRAMSPRGLGLAGLSSVQTKWPTSLLLLGSAMGWILLLDTFAVFPVSLYALGYSEKAAIFGLVLAAALWTISMRSASMHEGRHLRHLAIVLLGAIAIHTFTRLPSGNAWDAMYDPWLWLVAQGALFARMVRFMVARFKSGKRTALPDQVENTGIVKP